MNNNYNNKETESVEEEKKKKLPAKAYVGIVISAIGLCMFLSLFFVMNKISPNFIPVLAIGGMILIVVGFLVGGYMIFARLNTNMSKNIIDTNKDTLKDISNESANISKDAIKTISKSVKEAISDKNSKYCKHCGNTIDDDSEFCKYCGGKQ